MCVCIFWLFVKVAQSCQILFDLMDYIVQGILQARILEWVAYPFSSRSSQPRNWTRVSCIAGGFFTNWAIREHNTIYPYFLYSLTVVFHWTVLLAWLQILLMETRKASHKFLITVIIIHSYEWLIITSSINHSCYFAQVTSNSLQI